MIDLDSQLSRWAGAEVAWTAEDAIGIGRALAEATGVRADWEPGDEEWVGLSDGDVSHGIISIRVPLALLTAVLGDLARQSWAQLTVVEVADTSSGQLRASPDLLRATLLPHGWSEDFDPAGFCVQDLYVESV